MRKDEKESVSFGEYVWEQPPQVSISGARTVKELLLPMQGSVVQQLGKKRRRVQGKGSFFGKNCREEFAALWEVFEAGEENWLCLPGCRPFMAVFTELKKTADTQDVVAYTFLFTECAPQQSVTRRGVYLAIGGESLWDYSALFGVDIETLVNANPHIAYIDGLQPGERVNIP